MSIKAKIGWGILMFLAVIIALLSSRYLTLDPETFFPEQREVYEANLIILVTHVAGAIAALILGPIQFIPSLRKGRRLKVHRWLGRIYLTAVMLGGISGLVLAQVAYGGLITRLGFSGLALAWLFTAVMAYLTIRQKQVETHKAWMIRNYALTFAAVTLRLYTSVLPAFGLSFEEAYILASWLAWLPNLLVAEWIVTRTKQAARRQMRLG